jgi:hypothetical protein
VPDTGVNKVLQLESQEGVVKHGPNSIVGDDCTDSDTVVWGDRVNCGVDRTDKGIDLNNKQIINTVDPPNFTHTLYVGGHDVGEHQKVKTCQRKGEKLYMFGLSCYFNYNTWHHVA